MGHIGVYLSELKDFRMLRLLLCGVVVSLVRADMALQTLDSWNGGHNAKFDLSPDHHVNGWCAHVIFDAPVDSIEIWKGKVQQKCSDGKEILVANMPWDADLQSGSHLEVRMTVRHSGGNAIGGHVVLSDSCSGCGGTQGSVTQAPANTPAPGGDTPAPAGNTGGSGTSGAATCASGGSPSQTKFNYKDALGLSILFYDAQRSGRLPANNPIPWRGDSAVNDGDNGVDLSGGWYDAGDHVKFNLPMSSSTTVLLWGLTKWKDGYEAAGQLDMMYDMIRWPLEYFLKCWRPQQQEYYVQVGDGGADHAYWGRPEDMHMGRPAFKVTASRGGSDVAGETAASFAAGSIAFKTKDAGFSAKLLDAAKSIYEFAKNHKGIYSQSVPQAKDYYGSNGYNDELCEGAVWLYKATNDAQYLNDAKGFFETGPGWALSWDDKIIACQLLLFEVTQDAKYKTAVQGFLRDYMPGGSLPYTPCGLVFRNDWGSLRYAGNAAFVALMAAEEGIGGDDYKKWAMSQMHYILGDNNRHMSYEIGFGSNYPRHPHHRGSSSSNALLKGALVGGPDQGDNYQDRQEDYQKNEVACDYNSGFQGALAGLVHFANCGNLPSAPPAKC